MSERKVKVHGIKWVFCSVFVVFEIESHYLTQAGLEIKAILPQPPACWDSGQEPPRLMTKF